jgi:hypothetical protein
VHDRRHLEVAQAIVVEPEIASDAHRPFRKPGRMHAGVEILQIEQLIQRADHGRTRVKELRLQLLDLKVVCPGRGWFHRRGPVVA